MPDPNETIESLPQWAQTLIGGLRSENAEHRTKVRDAEKKVTELEGQVADLGNTASGLQTQLDEQTAAVTAKDTELSTLGFARTRDRLALERGIPLNIAESLNASDEESLTTTLDALAALRGPGEPIAAPTPQPNPAQAADPGLDAEAQRTADAEAFFSNARS